MLGQGGAVNARPGTVFLAICLLVSLLSGASRTAHWSHAHAPGGAHSSCAGCCSHSDRPEPPAPGDEPRPDGDCQTCLTLTHALVTPIEAGPTLVDRSDAAPIDLFEPAEAPVLRRPSARSSRGPPASA